LFDVPSSVSVGFSIAFETPVGDTAAILLIVSAFLTLLYVGSSALTVAVTAPMCIFGGGWDGPARQSVDPTSSASSKFGTSGGTGLGSGAGPMDGCGTSGDSDAVEVSLWNGKRFRIGTDDSSALIAALR
jgi:hypothetical protein